MKTYLPIGVAVLVMIAAAYVQGQWSERWGTFPELEMLSSQLSAIPINFGEWEGKDEAASDEKVLKIAGAEGELIRTYKNANGDSVRLSIICGRLQDITYHTPDRCYPAAGFEMQGDPQSEIFEIDGKPSEFLTTSFLKSEPTGSHVERGYWSWSGDGTWKTPKNPKLEFASQQSALYKLYVFASVPPGSKQRPNDPDFCKDFIRDFIPVAEKALRPALEKAGRVKPAEAAVPASAG